MEDGSLYPSIYMKIHGQPCLFNSDFHKTQASNSIPATIAFFNGVLQSRLGPPHQGSSSPTVTPMSSKSVGVTSKKGNASNPVLQKLFWVSSLMTTAPVNRVMVLMRCQNEMIKSGRLSYPYKGIADCFARTVRNEGIISMWKGNTSHMIGLMTMKFMHGSVRDNCSTLFNYKREDSIGKQVGLLLAANSLSRAATLVLIHPFEYAKTRMANDINTKGNIEKRQFNGIIDVFRKTLKSNGIAGLYRGYIMANVAYLVNDVLVFVLEPKQLHKELGLQNSMMVGAMLITGVDVFVNLITYPMHTVVQRMMMRSGEAVKYKSSSDALLQILINEGVRSLYKGVSARITICAVTYGLAVLYLIILNKHRAVRSGQPTYSISIRWKNVRLEVERRRAATTVTRPRGGVTTATRPGGGAIGVSGLQRWISNPNRADLLPAAAMSSQSNPVLLRFLLWVGLVGMMMMVRLCLVVVYGFCVIDWLKVRLKVWFG
ncbi:hypothetical protein LWI29_022923 [Acer saccharum]|uniref:ADP/ATP translocase n=1 Tax=Acer saccharum TaxID=4024 RepID=A0AA39RS94_ACESA|nr:hypothetical protein LWI29_022923 [Acer saccharum]